MAHRLTTHPARPGRPPVRIGNCSGFYGDRMAAMREMLDGGAPGGVPLDVLTGDYLAELTMLILYRSKAKDPARGYASSFLRQLEDCLGTALARGTRIVANAGGLNPAGCADAVRALAVRLGLQPTVAHLEGDDLVPRLAELQAAGEQLRNLDTGAALTGTPVTANAYLGGWGIAAALEAGADIVVTGRVTDASLVAGPAAWWHRWPRDAWDALAGAVVAGHILECGAQATGGNYAFYAEVPGLEHVGFPLAEVHADGSSVITKPPGTGGLVSVGTVTAQLLYEIAGPRYLGPDVTARFDTIRLEPAGQDRVRVSGVRGEPPPPTIKVALNLMGGLRNSVSFLLTGLDIAAKAALVTRQLMPVLETAPEHDVSLLGTGAADPTSTGEAAALLRVTVKGDDPTTVGRAFSGAAVELGLASYPGATLTAPPGDASPYGVFWPAVVDAARVPATVVLPDGRRRSIPSVAAAHPGPAPGHDPSPQRADLDVPVDSSPPHDDLRHVPLGACFGARSGDKGGNANLGVWARHPEGYAWLATELTVDRLRELLPEIGGLPVERHPLPNLLAVNFVVAGLLGEGVASSMRLDPQAKALGELLRARLVALPARLLDSTGARQ